MPARFTQRLKTDRIDELILAISMSNTKQTGDYLKEFIDLINRYNETDLKIKKVKVLKRVAMLTKNFDRRAPKI